MSTNRWLYVGLGVVVMLLLSRVLPSLIGPALATWRLGPKVEERPVAAIAGVGDAFDPTGDCKILRVESGLSIGVPGTRHDLSVEHGVMSAPRVVRSIEGDFEAEVTVAGGIDPKGGQTTTYAHPYHGAGLLLWLDRDNYVRLESAAILQGSDLVHYVNFEQRTSARISSTTGEPVPDGPVTLRLVRRGSRLEASFRAEGKDWIAIPGPASLAGWGGALKVGVAAVNTSTAPLAARFMDFRVGPPSR